MKANKLEEREFKSSRLYNPSLVDDLASLALYAKATSKTGHISSAILRCLEEKLLSEYYGSVSDIFKLIPELHKSNALIRRENEDEMIDAHLALRLHSWTFEDFLHLPEYLPSLEALRSGVEVSQTLIIERGDASASRNYNSQAISECHHFEAPRYSTISTGADPLRSLPIESEFSESLVPFDVESFEADLYAYTELQGITTYQGRWETMEALYKSSSFTLNPMAYRWEMIPTSHKVIFNDQDFFCRHPVTGEYGKGRHYYFADPIGRPLIVKDIKDFVETWNSFSTEELQIGSAGSLRSKISRDGHYKNIFGEQILHPKDKMILVNRNIEPRSFPKYKLTDRYECMMFQEATYNESKFIDVSTPFLQKKAAEQFGFKTFEQLMSSYRDTWQMTTVSDYFNLDIKPWVPTVLHEYGSQEAMPYYFKMNNNYSDFII